MSCLSAFQSSNNSTTFKSKLFKVIILSVTFTAAILISIIASRGEARRKEVSNVLKISGISDLNEDPSVTNFRNYLRIKSAHPNPDDGYESCINWLRGQASEIGLDFNLIRFEKPDLFAVWLTWTGSNPKLKSILVNSHMDVVAVDESKWIHSPFEAVKDSSGNIFGRGATDMKSATVAHLEAIRRLKKSGFQPLRTIHLSILPDEELGGNHGMKHFVKSPEFASLNVGFDIDETSVSPESNEMFISYGEKSIWQFNFTARGMAAHGSTLPETTAGQKLQVVINKLMEYRATQHQLSQESGTTKTDVTSINLVRLGGGNNIIPDELWASFDMRIRLKPGWNFTDVQNMLDRITVEAGPGVTYQFIQKSMESGITTPDNSNIWWAVLQGTCWQLNVTCTPYFLSGVTDGRYVRNIGIPAFGVNAFLSTPKMAHQDNECINEKNFLDGIERYLLIFKNIASVSGDVHP